MGLRGLWEEDTEGATDMRTSLDELMWNLGVYVFVVSIMGLYTLGVWLIFKMIGWM